MARDKNTRPCRDCGEQKPKFEWCETCGAYVCDDCNGLHDCIGDALEPSDASNEDDCPPDHSADCDDPLCDGDCLDGEEDVCDDDS